MLVKEGSKSYVQVAEGVQRRILAVGEKGMMGQFLLQVGACIPEHRHPHEQIGYLVSGEIVLTIDHQEYPVQPGDSWAILDDVPHSVSVLKSALVVEVFVPIREDFLD